MSGDRRIVDLTVGELYGILSEWEDQLLKRISAAGIGDVEPKLEYGLEGIQRIYGCSKATASRIKRSGVIDGAISQFGRKITIDVKKALQIKPKL